MNRQFLMMVDEVGLAEMASLFGTNIQFLEIQGMDIAGNQGVKILCTPIQPPVPPAAIPEPVAEPVVE